MGTFVRLATAVETGLRSHYIALRSSTQLPPRGVFQQLVEPTNLLKLYKQDCGYDLSTNQKWDRMRELMLHRHLFAHRSRRNPRRPIGMVCAGGGGRWLRFGRSDGRSDTSRLRRHGRQPRRCRSRRLSMDADLLAAVMPRSPARQRA